MDAEMGQEAVRGISYLTQIQQILGAGPGGLPTRRLATKHETRQHCCATTSSQDVMIETGKLNVEVVPLRQGNKILAKDY
jgi:hypothetical protein